MSEQSDLIEKLVAERDEARQWARHGYEIGQRTCMWSDYGVAPKWLTEGWPLHFEADPATRLLGQIEDLLTHYRALASAPSDADGDE